eukprot:sb/3463481/
MIGTKTDEQSVVTFSIHDNPSSCDIEEPKGIDFGKDYLSIPAHGNVTFHLRGENRISLNSYILSRNSPVLKNSIEKKRALHHDVSDFEPESFLIFVDMCYTGTIDLLKMCTEFCVFRDLFKLVTVFKVDWAKLGCYQFYRSHLPSPSVDFDAYWVHSLFALDAVVKYTDFNFIDHLLTCTPESKTKFQFNILERLVETQVPSELDLIMTMVVEFGLVGDFMKQLLTVMMFKFNIPLLTYWLENFNFLLCDKETLSLLGEAVTRNTSPRISCQLMEILGAEEKECCEEEDCEGWSIWKLRSCALFGAKLAPTWRHVAPRGDILAPNGAKIWRLRLCRQFGAKLAPSWRLFGAKWRHVAPRGDCKSPIWKLRSCALFGAKLAPRGANLAPRGDISAPNGAKIWRLRTTANLALNWRQCAVAKFWRHLAPIYRHVAPSWRHVAPIWRQKVRTTLTSILPSEEVKEEEDGSEEMKPVDETMATLARTYWVVDSSWPCSKERPFCFTRRRVLANELEGVEQTHEKDAGLPKYEEEDEEGDGDDDKELDQEIVPTKERDQNENTMLPECMGC